MFLSQIKRAINPFLICISRSGIQPQPDLFPSLGKAGQTPALSTDNTCVKMKLMRAPPVNSVLVMLSDLDPSMVATTELEYRVSRFNSSPPLDLRDVTKGGGGSLRTTGGGVCPVCARGAELSPTAQPPKNAPGPINSRTTMRCPPPPPAEHAADVP